MIKTLFCIALALGAAAVPVYRFMQPPDYGRTPASPLGELGKIEAWVQRWDHFDRSGGKVSEEESFDYAEQFAGLPKTRFAWRDMRENGYPREITLVQDRSGRISVVRAEFPTKTIESRQPELTEEELVFRLWSELAGREPRFTRMQGDDGIEYRDSFTSGSLRGYWVKSFKVPNSERSVCDVVRIFRVE